MASEDGRAPSRRDRIRSQLADLKMPGALKALDQVLSHIEAFNSVLRRECLSQHWFVDLEDAQQVLDR